MDDRLQKIVDHENAQWTRAFNSELAKPVDAPLFSSYWWEDYYNQITGYLDTLLKSRNYQSILEAGSGSGKATQLLKGMYDITLLDISSSAIEFAKHLTQKFNVKSKLQYDVGNILEMPYETEKFDFVWNIGVIEHYEPQDIKEMLREMIRVTKKDGIVAVGIPNLFTGPILKAWVLKVVKFIPGYKLDTERFYKNHEIIELFKQVSKESKREIKSIHVEYFGNPLIMETPRNILESVGKVINSIFVRNRFLKIIFIEFK